MKDQILKERTLFVLGVETAGLLVAQVYHLHGDNFQVSLLETGNDVADYVLGHGIRLDDREGALNSHQSVHSRFALNGPRKPKRLPGAMTGVIGRLAKQPTQQPPGTGGLYASRANYDTVAARRTRTAPPSPGHGLSAPASIRQRPRKAYNTRLNYSGIHLHFWTAGADL